MTTLTLAKIAEIEAAAAKATPGQRAVVDGHYPAFKELDGLSFKVSVVMFATDLTEKDYQARNADLSFLALCDPATVAALVRIARAAVEGTITDALRYRWLRQRHWNDSPMCVVKNPKEATKLGAWCPYGELLDAEIDAAMK